MTPIPAPAQVLLGSDAVAHVWTCNEDGTPQISVVWVLVRGDEIVFGTSASSRKVRNLERNPRVVLSVEDTERNERGFQRHLVIHGTATLVHGADTDLMDQLARKYLGVGRHPLVLRSAPDCVVVRVSVDRISGMGPWVTHSADLTPIG
jgi:PPOX class probable F420-dependent enzyme